SGFASAIPEMRAAVRLQAAKRERKLEMKAKEKNNTEAPAPNGAETSKLSELIKQYLSFGKMSAENFIKKCETLVEVEKLSDADRRGFCTVVKLEYSGSKSTYRKLLKIGQEASRFEPFLDRLPNNWTTLYPLAELDRDKFDRVTQDPRFGPMMTGEELKKIVCGESGGGERLRHDFFIEFEGLESSKMIEPCDKLRSLVEPY